MLGLYDMFLGLFGVAALVVSLLWKQMAAPFVLGAGLALTLLLAGTIRFNRMAIYDWIGINVYVAVMLAGLLLFAGGFGLSVKCIRWIYTVYFPRHSGS